MTDTQKIPPSSPLSVSSDDTMPDSETTVDNVHSCIEDPSGTSEAAADLLENIQEVTDPPEDPTSEQSKVDNVHLALTPTGNSESAAETFDRDYVEKLRDENAKYRQRARTADQLGQRLHAELVRATGRLADPTDLPYSEDHLTEPGALAAAIDDLLQRKPHLASRKPVGEIGQGAAPSAGPFDLAAMLRQRAR